jgi:hypothetical protein
MRASVLEAFWILNLVIEIPLAGIMYRRNLHRQFPIFFAYILFQVAGFAILFPLYHWGSSTDYSFAYWITSIVCWVFGFKVIREIFSDVFRLFPAQKDMGILLFRRAALVTAGLVFLLVCSTLFTLNDEIIGMERCVRFSQCMLILFLFRFSRYFRVSWRQQSIGIVLGFGWLAGVSLVISFLYSERAIQTATLNLLNVISYSLSLIVWITYAAFPSVECPV